MRRAALSRQSLGADGEHSEKTAKRRTVGQEIDHQVVPGRRRGRGARLDPRDVPVPVRVPVPVFAAVAGVRVRRGRHLAIRLVRLGVHAKLNLEVFDGVARHGPSLLLVAVLPPSKVSENLIADERELPLRRATRARGGTHARGRRRREQRVHHPHVRRRVRVRARLRLELVELVRQIRAGDGELVTLRQSRQLLRATLLLVRVLLPRRRRRAVPEITAGARADADARAAVVMLAVRGREPGAAVRMIRAGGSGTGRRGVPRVRGAVAEPAVDARASRLQNRLRLHSAPHVRRRLGGRAADGADALQQRRLESGGHRVGVQPHELIEKLDAVPSLDPRDPTRRLGGVGPGQERREKSEVRRQTLHVRLGHLAIDRRRGRGGTAAGGAEPRIVFASEGEPSVVPDECAQEMIPRHRRARRRRLHASPRGRRAFLPGRRHRRHEPDERDETLDAVFPLGQRVEKPGERVRRRRREIRSLAIHLREERAERRERRLARRVLLLASTTKRLLLLDASSPLVGRVADAERIRAADADADPDAAEPARLSLLALRLLGRHGRRDRRERLAHVRVLEHRRDGAAERGVRELEVRSTTGVGVVEKRARFDNRSKRDERAGVGRRDQALLRGRAAELRRRHRPREPRDVNRRQRRRRRAAVRLEQIRPRVIGASVSSSYGPDPDARARADADTHPRLVKQTVRGGGGGGSTARGGSVAVAAEGSRGRRGFGERGSRERGAKGIAVGAGAGVVERRLRRRLRLCQRGVERRPRGVYGGGEGRGAPRAARGGRGGCDEREERRNRRG